MQLYVVVALQSVFVSDDPLQSPPSCIRRGINDIDQRGFDEYCLQDCNVERDASQIGPTIRQSGLVTEYIQLDFSGIIQHA